MKAQINILRLCYPPISNQEAEWIKDDVGVQKMIKNSHLYMICQRAETHFSNWEKIYSYMNIITIKIYA